MEHVTPAANARTGREVLTELQQLSEYVADYC